MSYETTNVELEWDLDHQVALASRFNGGEPQATGVERQGDNTVWLPLVRDYPEDYLPGQPRLLGGATYHLDSEGDKVVATYPDADFSPEAFRRNAKLTVQDRAGAALSSTDWFVVRQSETGKPIPSEVRTARDKVRAVADEELQKVETMSPSLLQDYDAVEVNNAAKALQEVADKARLQ